MERVLSLTTDNKLFHLHFILLANLHSSSKNELLAYNDSMYVCVYVCVCMCGWVCAGVDVGVGWWVVCMCVYLWVRVCGRGCGLVGGLLSLTHTRIRVHLLLFFTHGCYPSGVVGVWQRIWGSSNVWKTWIHRWVARFFLQKSPAQMTCSCTTLNSHRQRPFFVAN
jgi:hypothetical protein